jgi:hypothetical protein
MLSTSLDELLPRGTWLNIGQVFQASGGHAQRGLRATVLRVASRLRDLEKRGRTVPDRVLGFVLMTMFAGSDLDETT